MPQSRHILLVAVVICAGPAQPALRAQVSEDRPALLEPATNVSKQQLDQFEAIHLYVQGLLHERHHRLLDAVSAFERAVVLDPRAAANYRALVPLYHVLGRSEDALRMCRQIFEIDPGDHETWYVYSRQLRMLGRTQEALAALDRAAECPRLKGNPGLALQVHFDRAVLHEDARQFDKAVAAYKQVTRLLEKARPLLEQGPLDPGEAASQASDAYERLGRAALQAGRHDVALTAFRKVQERQPDRQERVAYDLAQVYLAQKNLPEALACLEQYLSTQPHGTEAYQQWMKILRQLGKGNSVLPQLERYAGRDALNASLQMLLAEEYARAGHSDKAESLYRALAEKSPTPEVYRGLVALYRHEGKHGTEKILQILNDELAVAIKTDGKAGDLTSATRARAMLLVLRDDPTLIKNLLQTADRYLGSGKVLHPHACYFLAILAGRVQKLAQAETLFRRCLDSSEVLGNNETDVYGGLLKVLWQGKKYETVVEVCKLGLDKSKFTNHMLFHLDLARALILLGKADEAVSEARAAVDLADGRNRLACRKMRAVILADAGRVEDAVAECEALLREYPEPADQREIRYALSSVCTIAKMQPRAEEQLQLILQADPNDAAANNDLGYLWAEQGKKLREAEKMIRKAIELDRAQRSIGPGVPAEADRDNAAYLDSLGWVLFRRGRVEAARTELERATALPGGDDDPTVWDHLGDVCFRLGETASSRNAWTRAITIYQTGRRQHADERLKEIRKKIRLLDSQTQHR